LLTPAQWEKERLRKPHKAYDLKVDAEELVEKAEEIRKKLKELADQHRKMRKAEEKRGAPEAMYV